MDPGDDEDVPRTTFSFGQTPDSLFASDTIGHYLVAIEGAEAGRRIEISAAPITIGRDARQTLVFREDTELSRLHARVSLINGEAVAEDQGSTNGTFVDSKRVTSPVILRDGSVLRVGRQFLKYERRSRRDVERAEELDRDLLKASNYVLALLPAPLETGPVRVDWRFLPSAQLGGDAFGYSWLDASTFVFYLMDVSGHGVGAAMHSATVMNVLRQRALPDVDVRNPADVLSSLNAMFQMDSHGGMYFTMAYGVYRTGDRSLTYGSAGHHPAYLVPPDKHAAHPIGEPDLMIGVMPDHRYQATQTSVPAGTTLYLFSDGVFEIVTMDQRQWTLSAFLPNILKPAIAGTSESERLYREVKQTARAGLLDDDFSLMVVTFQ